jgi:hypothetical protein
MEYKIEYENLKRLLFNDENSQENKSGETPLIQCINYINSDKFLNTDQILLEKYLRNIFDNEFENFNSKTLSNFLFMISSITITDKTIFRDICLKKYRKLLKSKQAIEKRSLLINLLSEIEYKFTKKDIIENEDIKPSDPWTYIEMLADFDTKQADEEIRKHIEVYQDITGLLLRLPTFSGLFTNFSLILPTWYEILKKDHSKDSELKLLELWAKEKGYKLESTFEKNKLEVIRNAESLYVE